MLISDYVIEMPIVMIQTTYVLQLILQGVNVQPIPMHMMTYKVINRV